MTKVATLVAVLALAACPMQESGGSTMPGGARVTMPDLIGKTVEAVRAAGFKHETGSQSGMDSKDALILHTNKTLSIAPPPD